MRLLFVCCMLLFISSFPFAQQNREEKVNQLKTRTDIKVTEIEKDLLKLEYPNGKVLLKNIGDYILNTQNKINYSPTFDSTIIDLTTIDTTLYYQKYKFWQEVPLTNFDFSHLMVGDVNNNGKTELYGSRKFFETPTEPVCIYELDESDRFQFKYQYDSVGLSWNIYDLDSDGKQETHFLGYSGDQRFFSKETDTSYATIISTSFIPYDSTYQVNDATLGDFDKDGYTDLLFAKGAGGRDMHIFEYNPIINSFDSVYRFEIYDIGQAAVSGFSIGDFDLDSKTDIVFGTGQGFVYVIENSDNNSYTNSWYGMVETYAAYIHCWTNDIDKNGKPEFWVLGEAFYNGVGITRITIFETNGDNSYEQVGRVDLIGVFSFYAGTMQAVDIDNDGTEEIAICIDDNFLILNFNGNKDHHTYEVFYIKQNELSASSENSVYFGATGNDLFGNGEISILISMGLAIDTGAGGIQLKLFTQIYKPDSTTSIENPIIYIPRSTELYQNYPSPFNPTTSIKFDLNSSENISIKIYNSLGKEIRTLLDNYLPSGEHIVQWNGKDNKGNILPGGVYFIQMIAGSYQKTIKTILLK
ncbi:MAG: T9SS type A sorting domain-containing protein [Ignavibacteriota bacterium]|nr:T9SS C-terminal target domain-containing protein [Ignavibacteriota bacterium]MCO6446018.1 T9SS type A sorting domain-containing protein [Ignavibacterium album]QKJ99777.1 MAG: T9SS type A sorting domain-containing protein [Ignavibacteriota bacterium]HOJ06649.1 FlgD immunoglobulin-like domain containing protein [Ignavibacteriaceae bacterium]